MGQRAAHKRGKLASRDHLWSTMRELGSFNATELRKHTSYDDSTVRGYLKALAAAGFLLSEQVGKVVTYTLNPDKTSLEPPRVRKDGSVVTAGMGRKNLWRSAKILGEFSVTELLVNAVTPEVDIKLREAEDYVVNLVKAGYLTVLTAGKKGVGPSRYRFNMARYTGPKPPQVQRVDQVFDPNTREVVWRGGPHGK